MGNSPSAASIIKDRRFDGKNALITGANSGIGKELTRVLAEAGFTVYMACRNKEKAESARDEIKNTSIKDVNLKVLVLDLMDLESVKSCAQQFLEEGASLDLLICNAGIMACPLKLTKQGYESQFGVNHIAHHLFVRLLEDKLVQSTPSRVVMLSSSAHQMAPKTEKIDWPSEGKKGFSSDDKSKYNKWAQYGLTKLGNILFTAEFSKRVKEKNVLVNVVHPGVVKTNLANHLLGFSTENPKKGIFPKILDTLTFWMKTPEQGAASAAYCSVEESLVGKDWDYFVPTKKGVKAKGLTAQAKDESLQKKMWETTEEIIEPYL